MPSDMNHTEGRAAWTRSREAFALLAALVIVIAVLVGYLFMDSGAQTARDDPPPKESPATAAPNSVEPPAPNNDG
jgi:hypothetical protein